MAFATFSLGSSILPCPWSRIWVVRSLRKGVSSYTGVRRDAASLFSLFTTTTTMGMLLQLPPNLAARFISPAICAARGAISETLNPRRQFGYCPRSGAASVAFRNGGWSARARAAKGARGEEDENVRERNETDVWNRDNR